MPNQLTQNTFNNTLDNETQYINYALNNALLNLNTIFPAKVMAINGLYATVQPTINTMATNQASPLPSSITNVPIGYIIGGSSGIEIELQIGDIVLCGAIMRDVSSIKYNWTQQSNPASARKFRLSDAIILMGLRNELPTNKVKITDSGIEITAPGLPVTVTSDSATINANSVSLGNGAINGLILGNTVLQATIAGVQPGSGVTGVAVTFTSGESTTVKASN